MDLLTAAFVVLAEAFFDHLDGRVIPRELDPMPAKGSTQDDPFDVRVADLLGERIASVRPNTTVISAGGPLISPDMVILDDTAAAEGLEQARRNGPEAGAVTWAVGNRSQEA